MRTTSETSGTMLNAPTFKYRSPRRRRQKERPWENTWGDNSWKLPWNGEVNSHPSPRNPEIPKMDKPKAKHPKTHINQINKDQTQRTNIKSSKGKTANHTQVDSHKDNSWSFKRNSSGQEGLARHIKVMKENNLQPRLLYPARISFKYEGEIKSFTDKQKLREFSTTKPAFQQMLKDLL